MSKDSKVKEIQKEANTKDKEKEVSVKEKTDEKKDSVNDKVSAEKESKLKRTIAEEKEKMSKMTNKQKLEYFKAYYMKWTIVIVAALVCVIYFIFNNVLFPKTFISSGCGVNVFFTEELKDILGSGYKEYIGDANKRDESIITDEMFITFGGKDQKLDGSNMQMMLYSQVAAEQINYFVIDDTGLEWLRYQELCMPLDDVLSAETISRLEAKNSVIETEIQVDDDVMENKKFAVRLNDLGLYSKEYDSIYLLFTIASPSEGYEESFMKYLLECSDKAENN